MNNSGKKIGHFWKMRPYHKTTGRRKRCSIISPQYAYILNLIQEEHAYVSRISAIWPVLKPISRKFKISDIFFLGENISKRDVFGFYFS